MPKASNAEYLTQRAAAARLGVSMHTLGLLIDEGRLSGVRVTTESGHTRLQISVESVQAELLRRGAASAA